VLVLGAQCWCSVVVLVLVLVLVERRTTFAV
jgi:hypothetical protein